MRFIGRATGLGLVIIFILVLPTALWTFNLQRLLLDGNTYKQVFADEDFYDRLVPRVLPALLSDLDTMPAEPGGVSFLSVLDHLDSRDWRAIAPMFVPRDWVEREVVTNLDAFLAWLEGDGNLVLDFDTGVLRRQLAGPSGEAGVMQIVNALPACTPPQERDFERFLEAPPDTVAFPYCRPQSSALREDLFTLVNLARGEAADAIPDELDVVDEMRSVAEHEALVHAGEPLHSDPFSDSDLNQFRAGVRLWRNLLLLTLLIPLALLALIIITAIRSAKAFYRWIGWSLILGSLITLAPLYLLPFAVPQLSYEAELEQGFGTGGALIAELAGHQMLRLLVGAFTWPILIQSALLILIGFVFVVLSVLLHDPDRPRFAMPEASFSQTPSSLPPFETPAGYYAYQPPSGSTPGARTGTPLEGAPPETPAGPSGGGR